MFRVHKIVINDKVKEISSINFLCLAKSYRNQGLAPIIIQEITRVLNRNGIFQAIFTGKKDYGFSFTSCRYYHLVLDAKTLYKNDFIGIENESMNYELRNQTREAKLEDLSTIKSLFNNELKKYKIYEHIDNFTYLLESCKDQIKIVYNPINNEFASYFAIENLNINK